MKLMSIRRLIGLAAIYGAVQYARKHGGVKNAFDDLLGKAKHLADDVKREAEEMRESRAGHVTSYGYPVGTDR